MRPKGRVNIWRLFRAANELIHPLAAHNSFFPKGKKINVLVVFSSSSPKDSIGLGAIPYYIIISDFKNIVAFAHKGYLYLQLSSFLMPQPDVFDLEIPFVACRI